MPLETVLAELYQDEESIRRIATVAEIKISNVTITGKAVNDWRAVIDEASKQQRLRNVVKVVSGEYPNYIPLAMALQELPATERSFLDPLPDRVTKLENKVEKHETLLQHILDIVDPGPRRKTARAAIVVAAAVLLVSWVIPEIRSWYLQNPVQAVLILLAVAAFSILVRFVSEPDNERQ